MTQRDDVIQRLNAEVSKLRQQHKEKTSDVSRQSDMLGKLQEALTRAHVDLDDTRRKADNDVRTHNASSSSHSLFSSCFLS